MFPESFENPQEWTPHKSTQAKTKDPLSCFPSFWELFASFQSGEFTNVAPMPSFLKHT